MTEKESTLSMKQRDLLTGILLVLCALLFYVLTYHFGGYELEKVPYDMGPTFLPRLLLAALGIEAIFLIVFSLAKKAKSPAGAAGLKALLQMRPVIMFCAFLVYVYLATLLGYIVATIAFMVISFFLLGVRRVWTLVLVPPAITFATYYLFGSVLNIYLPSGSLF